MLDDAVLRRRFYALGPNEQVDVLGRALGEAVLEELDRNGLAGLGQETTDVIASSVMQFLGPLLPALGEKLKEIAIPAAERAAAVIEPGVKKALIDYGPTLAIITGVIAGAVAVAGMWFAKRYL